MFNFIISFSLEQNYDLKGVIADKASVKEFKKTTLYSRKNMYISDSDIHG